ncbi:MAPEG family protein [Thalassotalea mangrovi]|uniref:Glutathione S-transferase n=1 Tax=Thalassotalea mangrovi TaxID=2572245 RepID=A0A4U1B2H5_9GAMM|nr:MAPEG family protein [Thalassotalea mangrovi]TKB43640.1 glutathione S-transferase [Thalassotalea mangrovi]
MEHSLVITGFYAGILALLHIALSFKVIGLRRRLQIGLGDGNNKELQKAIRVHGNFSEYVPLAMIMFAVLEFNQGSLMLLHVLGGALVTCRFLHAIGVGKTAGISWQRFTGVLGTFLVILALAVMNIANILLAA